MLAILGVAVRLLQNQIDAGRSVAGADFPTFRAERLGMGHYGLAGGLWITPLHKIRRIDENNAAAGQYESPRMSLIKWRSPRMPRKPVNFKLTDLQRAIRAAREENLPLDRVEIDPASGKISIILTPPAENKPSTRL